MTCQPCDLCQTLEGLLDGSERVIVQGWRDQQQRVWIVDVVTPDREGHGYHMTLSEAIKTAISETGIQ